MDDSVGGDIAASAHSILDDEGLAKPLREPLCNEARKYVGRAASSQADDRAHWADRIVLRPSEPRHDGEFSWRAFDGCRTRFPRESLMAVSTKLMKIP
jgi:hypothetical protein